MSALRVIRDLLQKKANWRSHCLACDGAAEVYFLSENLEFFFCKACTRVHLDVLLDNGYMFYGGEHCQRRIARLAEDKMTAE